MAILFFEKIPLIGYDMDGSGQKRLAINILQRIKMVNLLQNDYLIFYEYDVKDGETPEIIADKLYGDSRFHWVVLLTNNIVDPRYDWPMSYENLMATIEKKYASTLSPGIEYATQTVHHYEDALGNIIDLTSFNKLPASERKKVMIYDWEMKLNESKRRIRLLDASFVDQIDKEADFKLAKSIS